MSTSLKISYFGATDIGMLRQNNEDTFIAQPICNERYILLAAIDGMGGEAGGEVAAEIARVSIIKYVEDFGGGSALNLIKRAVTDANNEIFRVKSVQPKFSRMGCVVTAGLIDFKDETLSIAHVGDSRLYRYSNNELSKLTHDHSFVGYQEENGYLTEEEAMKHPRRSVINRCVGESLHTAEDDSFIEAGVFPLIQGDVFLFCSDGLSDVLTNTQIADCLCPNRCVEEDCAQLIAQANKAGGKDNITVVELRVNRNFDKSGQASDTHLELTNVTNSVPNEATQNQPSPKIRKLKIKFVALSIFALIIALLSGFEIGRRVTLLSVKKSNNELVEESVRGKNADNVVNNDKTKDSCELVHSEIE